MTNENIKLGVDSPDMRDRECGFSVEFPKVISEASYKLIRANLEFRRKCMNQGFDNLIELLDMHWNAVGKFLQNDLQEKAVP